MPLADTIFIEPFEIEKRIVKLSFDLDTLTASYRDFAYQAEAGASGAAEQRDRIARQRDTTAKALEDARAALAGAGEAVRRRQQAEADKVRQARDAKVKKALSLREAAAKEIAHGLTQANRGWRSLIAATREVDQLAPQITLDHGGDILGIHRLRDFVEAELFRVGATGLAQHRFEDFPGGNPHADVFLADYRSSPASLPRLVDNIAQLDQSIVGLLDAGKV